MAAEIPDGAVLVARAILNSSLWTMRAEDCKVAMTCIALCNWRDRKWYDGERDTLIHRGQFVRSLKELAEASRLSVQKLRTSMRNLEKVGFLTRKSTCRWTIVTLPKYNAYQDLTKYSDREWPLELTRKPTNGQQTINTQPTNGQQTTNNKQVIEEGEERKEGGRRASLGASAGGNGHGRTSLEAILRRAKALEIPNRPATIERYVRSWVAKHGPEKVASLFEGDLLREQSVIEIEDLHFRSDHRRKPGPAVPQPKREDPKERQLTSAQDEARRRRRDLIIAKRSECAPEELRAWEAEAQKDADEKRIKFGRSFHMDIFVLLKVARKFGIAQGPDEF